MGIFPIDWTRFAREFPLGLQTPFFSQLTAKVAPNLAKKQIAAQEEQLLEQLQQATTDEEDGILLDYVTNTVVKVLGLDHSQLKANQPLDAMGLDSLMSAELKNNLSAGLKIDLPMVVFVEGVTVTKLVTQIGQLLGDTNLAESMTENLPQTVDDSTSHLDNLDVLSDEEVEKLLNSMIS